MIGKKKKVFFLLILLLFRPIEAMDTPKVLLNEIYTGNQKVEIDKK